MVRGSKKVGPCIVCCSLYPGMGDHMYFYVLCVVLCIQVWETTCTSMYCVLFSVSSGMGDHMYFYVHMIFGLNGLLASGIALLGTFVR